VPPLTRRGAALTSPPLPLFIRPLDPSGLGAQAEPSKATLSHPTPSTRRHSRHRHHCPTPRPKQREKGRFASPRRRRFEGAAGTADSISKDAGDRKRLPLARTNFLYLNLFKSASVLFPSLFILASFRRVTSTASIINNSDGAAATA
jgi:hypothetical protein